MRGCLVEGAPAYVSFSPSPARKLSYTWHSIRLGQAMIGINTHLPNKLIEQALLKGLLEPFVQYSHIEKEKTIFPGTRIDFGLKSLQKTCFLEVKNVHYAEEGVALFPDSPTLRGIKHLKALIKSVENGHKAAVIYVVQRSDCYAFSFCDRFDPEYAKVAGEALSKGVDIYAYDFYINPTHIRLKGLLDLKTRK